MWGTAIVFAGVLAGGLEASAYAEGMGVALYSFFFGGALVSLVTIPLGLVLALGVTLTDRSLQRLKIVFPRGEEECGERLAQARALVSASVLSALGVVIGVVLLVLVVRSVTETPELVVTAGVGAVVLLGFAGAGVPVFAWILRPAFSKVGEFSAPRWLGSALFRYAIFVLVPGALFAVLAIVSTPSPELRLAGGGLLFLVIAPGLWLLMKGANLRVSRLHGAVASWLCLLSWSVFALHRGWLPAAERPGLTRLALDQLGSVSDFDGDGHSSLFGGADCAPFSAGMFPGARDLPGNGIDEDCDGTDGRGSEGEGASQEVVLREGALISGALSKAQVKKYNVLWLMVDAVRADHLHLLGGEHENTPFIEELAKESLVFSHAYSQSSGTPTSIASMLTGRTPGSIRWTAGENGTRRPQLDERMVTAAELFKNAGYRTAGSLSRGMLDLIPKTLQGFDDTRGLPGKTGSSELVIDMLNADRKFHKDRLEAPFFVFGYYHGPHGPYRGAFEFGKGTREKYDSAIRRTDAELAVVIEYLKHHPRIWNNTVVVIHSDHGEEFGEHGQSYHNNTCHMESVRIPIILRVPGLEPAQIDLPVANVDIVATLLELTGIDPPPEEELDGESLLIPALTDRGRYDRPILCFQQNRKGDGKIHGSARTDRWYLDVTLGDGSKKLFDVVRDPGEQKNVYRENREDPAVRGLFELIERHHTGNLNRGKWAKM